MYDLVIGAAQPNDAPLLLELQRSAYRIEAERYGVATLPPMTETLDELLALLATHTILVARRTPAGAPPIAGTVRARVESGTAYIARLAVWPSLHGRGIGRRLLGAIERAVTPVERYELFTGHRSTRNLRMYERAGYRPFRTSNDAAGVQITVLQKAGVAPYDA